MSSAMERAVEAGARAASPHAFNDAFWLTRGAPDHHQRHARENARNHAAAVLRAAFPILAEELVRWHDEQAYETERYAKLAQTLAARQEWEFVASTHRSHAATMRARIQQMAEAL